MANDQGAKRLILTYLGSFASNTQETRTRSLRVLPLSSLGNAPNGNGSARTIHLTGGLKLYQAPEFRDRNAFLRSGFSPLPSLIKVFY